MDYDQRIKYLMVSIFLLTCLSLFIGLIELLGFTIPLSLILYTFLDSKDIPITDLTVKRTLLQDRISQKEELTVYLTIKNESNYQPIEVLELMDKIPEETTISNGTNHFILTLDPLEEIQLEYSVITHKRGRYKIGPIYTRTSEFINRKENEEKIELYNNYACVPDLIKLKGIPVIRDRLLPNAGTIPSKVFKGRDFDFQGVREYHYGDELRDINWRVTAKLNKLATNEYAFDQDAQIIIILDHTISNIRMLEESIVAALSLSEYAIRTRNLLELYTIGEFIQHLQPARGKKHLLTITERLIDVYPGYPQNEDVLKIRAKEGLFPFLSGRTSFIFFISPLNDPTIAEIAEKIIRKGYKTIWINPLAYNDYQHSLSGKDADLLANSIIKYEEIIRRRKMSNFQIPIVDWSPTGPVTFK